MTLKLDWKFAYSLFTGDKMLLTCVSNVFSDDFNIRKNVKCEN